MGELNDDDLDDVIDVDPWADDPLRKQRLQQCYEVDVEKIHLQDHCHWEEDQEVRQTIRELYGDLYSTYAIYAGRSQWPLIRQVDVYGFFEEARLLNRAGPVADN